MSQKTPQVLLNVTKIHPNTPDLAKANKGDAGYDLYAMTLITDNVAYLEFGTGLAIELQEGSFGLLCARSSISNYDMDLCNGVGILDNSFRGEIRFRFRKLGLGLPQYKLGDKIGQLVIVNNSSPDFLYKQTLSPSDRGEGGFGSSGT